MLEEVFIRNLGIMVVAAAATSLAAYWLRLPGIVAYVIAGLLIGPAFRLVQLEASIDLISEIGIILLLFLVGLELNFRKIRDVAAAAFAGAFGQGVFIGVVAFLLLRLVGFELAEAAFIGVLVSFSSTVLAVKLLGETNELDTVYGRIAVGVLLIQDLMVVVMLTFMTGLGAHGDISVESLTADLLRAFAGMAVLVGVVAAASRYILPGIFSWARSATDTAFIFSLTWCFIVVMGAEMFDLSLEIGAFLAGLGLGQIPYNQELHRRVRPLMNLFLAVFFVSLGVRMKVSPADVDWLLAILLSASALLLKPVAFVFINWRVGYSARSSFFASVTMAQTSEFSMILAAAGAGAGILSVESTSLISLVALITMGVSAYMIQRKERLFELASSLGVLRFFSEDTREEGPGRADRSGHVIVVGMNTLGREIVHRLTERGEDVLAIDSDPAKLENLPCDTLQGSVEHLSLLLEAGLPKARLVVSALQIEDANDLLAHRCRSYKVPCSIHAIDLSVIDNLLSADVGYLMIPKVDGIKVQTRELRKMGYIR